jgi:hypothetical protein
VLETFVAKSTGSAGFEGAKMHGSIEANVRLVVFKTPVILGRNNNLATQTAAGGDQIAQMVAANLPGWLTSERSSHTAQIT